MRLELHSSVKKRLSSLSKDLPQSLLLHGKVGVGLGTIARFLAGDELAEVIQPTDIKGTLSHTGSIGVEEIRKLYDQTKTKHHKRRIIIIDDAERMTKSAQAAFLKLLEEPNDATHFILTAHDPGHLLPTIRSRLQDASIPPVTNQDSAAFIANLVTDEKKRLQLHFMAAGLPAEILRILASDTYFDQKAKIITDARTFLQADTYQKLRIVHMYRTDREAAIQLLDGAMAIVKHTLTSKPQHTLISQIEQLLSAKEQISANGNIALTLTRIVL